MVVVTWQQSVPQMPGGVRGLLGDKTAILLGADAVLCLDRETGRPLWRQLMKAAEVSPVQAGQCWVLALSPRNLAGVALATGQTLWVKECPAPITFLAGDEDKVVVVGEEGTISMFASATGDLLWQKPSEGEIQVAPAFADQDLCVVARSETLVAYRCHDGKELWKRPLEAEIMPPLMTRGGEFFALDERHTVGSWDARTGQPHWKRNPAEVLLRSLTRVEIVAVTDEHLFLHSSWGRLSALSRATGELRAVSNLDAPLLTRPLVTAGSVVFATPSSSGDLAVFDRQIELLHNRLCLPPDAAILDAQGNQVLVQQPDGRLALVGLHLRAPDPYQELAAGGDAGVATGAVLAIAISATLLCGAFAFAMVGQPKIPPTQMSSLLLFALLICAGALCTLTARMGWFLLNAELPRSWVSVAMATLLFSPAICLGGMHLALWWRGGVRGDAEALAAQNPESLKVIRRLTRDMGLPGGTAERIRANAHGPFVTGVSRHRFQLALPGDLDERVARACGRQRHLAAGLLRLVLAHELAHVRNGDIQFLPLLTAALRLLPWCFAAIVAVLLLLQTLGTEVTVSKLASGMLGITIVGGMALWILLKLALRERERLADATATLFLSPATVRRLTRSGHGEEEALSPLAAFLAGLRIRSPARKRVLGFSGGDGHRSAARWRSWTSIARSGEEPVEFARAVTERSRALVRKQHALLELLSQNWPAAVAAGLVAGLLLAAFAHFLAIDFFGCLLAYRAKPTHPVSGGFLKAYPMWSQTQSDSVGWTVAHTLAPLIAGMLLAATALLPWRDAARKSSAASQRGWFHVVVALLLALVVAGVVFTVTAPAGFPFPSFPMLRVSAAPLWLWSAIAGLMFAGLLAIRAFTRRMRRILVEACMMLALVATGGVICWWLLAGLSTNGRLLWTIALILLPGSVLTTRPCRRLLAQEDYSDEAARFIRVFGVSRLFCNRLGGELKLTRSVALWLMAYALAVFCLPGLLIALPLRPALLKLDAARFELARSHGIEMARLIEAAPRRIPADRSEFAREFLPLLLQRRLFDPFGPRPSTWLGVGALTCGCLMGFGVFGTRALRGKNQAQRVLAIAGAMVRLFDRLDLPTLKRRFKPQLEAALKTVGLHVTEAAGMPLLVRTCEAVECAARLGLAEERRARRVAAILQAEAETGGFGLNRQPTLQHTVAALRLLRWVNTAPRCGYGIHERWLRNTLAGCWRQRMLMAPSAWLETTGLVVEGLEQIDGAPQKLARRERFGRHLVQAAYRIWQNSERSTRETRHLAMILSVWERPARSISAELRQTWLPRWEQHLTLRHPDAELKELADSVTLLSRLFPVNYAQRPSLVQVADNLEKHWRHAK
jgi:outer membrane protein assembly factor BamB